MTNIIKPLLTTLLLLVCSTNSTSPWFPRSYWQFEDSTDPLKDSRGVYNLKGDSSYHWEEHHNGGAVGNFISFNSSVWDANCGDVPFNNSTLTEFTLEFLFKPGPYFQLGGYQKFWYANGALDLTLEEHAWDTSVNRVGFSIPLNETGRKATDYFGSSTRWHHIVYRYSTTEGVSELWIDGQLPTGFTGSVPKGEQLPIMHLLLLSCCSPYSGGLDEVAIYEKALPAVLIVEHWKGVQHGQHYSPHSPGGHVPPPEPVTGTYDLRQFAPGTRLPSPPGNSTQGVTTSCLEQLLEYPLPHHHVTYHTLYPNYNWLNVRFMGGDGEPGVSPEKVTQDALAINMELSNNWNYGVVLGNMRSCCEKFQNETLLDLLANGTATTKLDATILRAQTPGGTSLHNQSLVSSCYLQNSDGRFISKTGQPLPVNSKHKVLRPLTGDYQKQLCPVSLFARDGQIQLASFQNLNAMAVEKGWKGSIFRVNNDGETFGDAISGKVMSMDPVCKENYAASKLSTWEAYWSTWRVSLERSYSQAFMDHTQNGNLEILKGALYSEYQVQGTNPYFGIWNITRQISSKVRGQYYSTADYYPRYPKFAERGAGPWHGLDWMLNVRRSSVAAGNGLFSPFVAAGWSYHAEGNVRPGQWLGLLKLLSVWGAEWFYTGFFSVSKPFPRSQNWCWQAVMPSYVQSITSLWSDVLFDGNLLNGNMPGSEPRIWAGHIYVWVFARKHKSKDTYVVTATHERISNIKNNIQPQQKVTVTVDTHKWSLMSREQGSVYMIEQANSDNPVVTQLDEWHENAHPGWWSKVQKIEAEVALLSSRHMNNMTALSKYTHYHSQQLPQGEVDFVASQTYVMVPPNTCFHHKLRFERLSRKHVSVCVNSDGMVWIQGAVTKLKTSGTQWETVRAHMSKDAEQVVTICAETHTVNVDWILVQ